MFSLDLLDGARARYATDWSSHNAAGFEAGGHYDWMAEQLATYPNVLEIGTGDGRPAAVLLRRGHAVVSIDENPACVMLASDRLREADLPVFVVEREAERLTDGRNYRVGYADVGGAEMPPRGTAVLVEGDVLSDASLREALQTLPPFDAVTCWLIGTHQAVHFNAAINSLPTDQSTYRLRVQNTVYELAEQLLRPGGVLHVVDRTHRNDEEARRTTLEAHQEQAEPTSLEVVDVCYRDCLDARADAGIAMVRVQLGTPPGGSSPLAYFLVAITAKKSG